MWSLEDFEKSELIELIRQNTVCGNLGFRPVYSALCIRKDRLEKEIRSEMDCIACYDELFDEAKIQGYGLFMDALCRWKQTSIKEIGRLKDELAEVIEEMSNVL